MNKTKRVLSVVLAVLMLSSLIAALAIADDEATVKVIINYVFEDGEQAANPWTAKVAKGSALLRDVDSPTVVGYTPNQTSVNVNVSNAQDDVTYTVTYYPALVDLTIKHYQQNIADDKYTLFETEKKTAYTESAVGDKLAKSYEGFTALLYDTTTKVAADGSTVVEIYYDRNLYLMSFDLDGGYGVEPIYAKYQTPVSVADPTKPGYTFNGWEPTVPATVPAENTTYTAKWTPGESGFTVVFWYENANDDGYSYAGSIKPTNVAPGTQKSSGDYQNANFTGRDDAHFTYNTAKNETVTVKGDGSTVLNVYFTRNTYTLTFKNAVLSCGKVEHSHRSSCYKDLTITAKWDADISSYFPILDANGNAINWNVSGNVNTVAFDVMPDVSRSYTADGTISNDYNCFYYLEIVEGTTTDAQTVPLDGKTFALYKKVPVPGGVSLTYKEEFHDILGFTQYKSDPKFASVDSTPAVQKENKFYYTRNSYNLRFYNYNGFVADEEQSVQYEAPLKGKDFTPDYPTGLEANAYEFAGWYTTEGCFDGSEVDWDTAKMPAGDVVLYAKWAPKTHTVRTWLTDKLDVKVNVGETEDNEQKVAHGSYANAPETPTNGNYTFVGWFYKENGEDKAFDFANMPVTKDLELFAKWSSNVLVKYTIHYQLADGTTVADDTTGSALAASTKTFDAKTGTNLYKDYQTGYFPETGSHSLIMNIDDGENEFTFIYVPREKVSYTVKYLEKGTNAVLHEEKTGETSDAIITEKFVQIKDYAPDAYQKRLVLSATESENEIIFWYTKDEVHAPVQVIHWVQNIEGEGYTEQQSSSFNGDLKSNYKENPLSIPGFEYKRGTAVSGDTTTEFDAPNAPEAVLTEAGLVLNLYYNRIEYPYEFRFVDESGREIDEPKTGMARYEAQVTCTAPDKIGNGYKLKASESSSKDIIIAIENPADVAKINVKEFVYEEYFTVVHVKNGGKDVTPEEVTLTASMKTYGYSLTDAVTGGYLYGGTFDNAECTTVHNFDKESAISFTPEKGKTYYIWEVDQKYLAPKTYTFARPDQSDPDKTRQVTDLFLMTTVDRGLYQEVGFGIGSNNFASNPGVYSKVSVVYVGSGKLKEELYVASGLLKVTAEGKEAPNDRDIGYIGAYKLTDEQFTTFKTTPFTFVPYWVTLDGIRVTGINERQCTYTAGNETIGVQNTEKGSQIGLNRTSATQTVATVETYMVSRPEDTLVDVPVTPDAPVTPEVTEVPEAPDMTLNSDAMYLRAQYTYEMMTNTVKFISAIDVNACTEYGFVINGEVVKCEEAVETVDGYDANYLFGGSVNGAMLMSCNMLLDGLVDGMTLNVTPYYVALDGTVVYGETRTLVYRQWVGLEG